MKLSKHRDILASNAIISNMQACDHPGANPGKAPMKSFIMNTMKSGTDQSLQLSFSDSSHCKNLLSVAHISASLYPFELKCPMMTASSWILQLHFRKIKKRGFASSLKRGQGTIFSFAHIKRNLVIISMRRSSCTNVKVCT